MVLRATAAKLQPDERGLVEAAQRDPAGFAALYELHFDRVYVFIVRRVGNRQMAEGLTAEVFRRALAHLPTFQWRDVPFRAWLLRIAANAVTDRARQSGRQLNLEDPPEPSAEPELADVEEGARLFALVKDLPEDQQRVLVMRFAEQRSIRTMAQLLKRSEGAVKQLQFRSLENLRKRLESGATRTPRKSAKPKPPGGEGNG